MIRRGLLSDYFDGVAVKRLSMVETTPTDYWNDSCAIAELEYAVERGATGATSNPVIVGEVTRAWQRVGPIIKETVRQHSFTRAETQIVPSDPITQPRLRGTIALVLLKHFGAPAIA